MAELAPLKAPDISDAVRCRICCELFNNPMSLQCHHTFCSLCLLELPNAQEAETQDGQVVCPTCKLPTPEDKLVSNIQAALLVELYRTQLISVSSTNSLNEKGDVNTTPGMLMVKSESDVQDLMSFGENQQLLQQLEYFPGEDFNQQRKKSSGDVFQKFVGDFNEGEGGEFVENYGEEEKSGEFILDNEDVTQSYDENEPLVSLTDDEETIVDEQPMKESTITCELCEANLANILCENCKRFLCANCCKAHLKTTDCKADNSVDIKVLAEKFSKNLEVKNMEIDEKNEKIKQVTKSGIDETKSAVEEQRKMIESCKQKTIQMIEEYYGNQEKNLTQLEAKKTQNIEAKCSELLAEGEKLKKEVEALQQSAESIILNHEAVEKKVDRFIKKQLHFLNPLQLFVRNESTFEKAFDERKAYNVQQYFESRPRKGPRYQQQASNENQNKPTADDPGEMESHLDQTTPKFAAILQQNWMKDQGYKAGNFPRKPQSFQKGALQNTTSAAENVLQAAGVRSGRPTDHPLPLMINQWNFPPPVLPGTGYASRQISVQSYAGYSNQQPNQPSGTRYAYRQPSAQSQVAYGSNGDHRNRRPNQTKQQSKPAEQEVHPRQQSGQVNTGRGQVPKASQQGVGQRKGNENLRSQPTAAQGPGGQRNRGGSNCANIGGKSNQPSFSSQNPQSRGRGGYRGGWSGKHSKEHG